MPTQTLQIPSIILPDVSAQVAVLGTETEAIDDLLEHTSMEFPVEYLQEKQVHIVATEVSLAPAAVPGNLWCWIELSPYPSANTADAGYWPPPLPSSAAYWAAIGGGGGAIIPTVPYVEVSGLAGLPGTLVHTIILPWEIHSPWARLVLQTPVAASLPNASWVVQCMISSKTP